MKEDITDIRKSAHCSDEKFAQWINKLAAASGWTHRFRVIYEDERVYVERIDEAPSV